MPAIHRNLLPALLTLLLTVPPAIAAENPTNTPVPRPQRVMSLNVCNDQLLMLLLPPERIVSLTWLSRTEGDPQLAALARQLPVNHGSAEEVLEARPDLVVAGRFTTGTTRALLRRAGIALLEVDPVMDWEGIRRVTREVAAHVGAVDRGEALIAAMDADLSAIAAEKPFPPVRVMGWGGASEDVPTADTLFNAILETAGGVNVAAHASRRGYDVEKVLRLDPEVLMRGAAYAGKPALRDVAAMHPALRQRFAGRTLTYPEGIYGCGGPQAARWARELSRALQEVRAREVY